MAGEKTEKATGKRRQEERKKGNVLMSQEINTVFALLVIFFALQVLLPGSFTRIIRYTTEYLTLGGSVDVVSGGDLNYHFIRGCTLFALTALPLLLATVLASIILTMGQTRMLFAAEAFSFKGDRLNPLSGIKKMFSMRSVVELIKAVLKITILGYLIYVELREAIHVFPRLMDMQVIAAAAFTGNLILAIVWRAGAVFAVLAAADYFYQWWEYEKNLRMTKQEVKDEYKETEGDPQIKSRQRARREQAARKRMMDQVPQSDVVVRNPTHFAVALRYDPDKHQAPVVTAKGMDHLALRIVQIAKEHEVFVIENKPLARALFEQTELDREVPETLYQAVAEVLVFVYDLMARDGRPVPGIEAGAAGPAGAGRTAGTAGPQRRLRRQAGRGRVAGGEGGAGDDEDSGLAGAGAGSGILRGASAGAMGRALLERNRPPGT